MSMTVSELQEKRRIAWEAAKDFLETHRMDNGLIPATDVKTYEKMEREIQNYSEEIARLERLQKLDDAMRRPTSEPLTRRPGKSAAGRASDEYRSAMLTALRSNFKDVSNILREGQDESGGYLSRMNMITGSLRRWKKRIFSASWPRPLTPLAYTKSMWRRSNPLLPGWRKERL